MPNETLNEAPPINHPGQQLGQMICGYWISQSIYVAAKLGIADELQKSPCTVKELAGRLSVNESALYRLLRALASVGIFKEESEGWFSLTPTAELLRHDHPESKKAFATLSGALYQAWGNIEYAVKTGNQSFKETYKMPLFEFLTRNPEQGKIFDAAMTGIHGGETGPMLDAYDFSAFKTVADIGGGNGLTLSVLLTRYPQMKGILFDLPDVVKRSEANIKKSALAPRCALTGGDFFKAVPQADAYVLRHIIHDWPDDQAVVLLKNCRAAMNKGGKVLIVENVIPADNSPHFGKWLDLMMLVIGGKERTEQEYKILLRQAGLKMTRVIPTALEISIVEGTTSTA